MERLTLTQLVEILGGRTRAAAPALARTVDRVSTDSRAIRPDDVFFALSGPRFDGHEFVRTVSESGAAACVVGRDRKVEGTRTSVLIEVDEPLLALERLALWQRGRLGARVTAITGSVGKTTTKEFLATLLSERFRVERSPRSYNNRLGVALTILGAPTDTEELVLELGTSAPGEISHLSRCVRPDRVIVTAVAPAHLAGLGSVDGVIEAKSEIFDGATDHCVSFLAADLVGFDRFAARAPSSVVTFGVGDGEFLVAEREVYLDSEDRLVRTIEVEGELLEVSLPGRHNLSNLAAGLAVARHVGLSWAEIRRGLARLDLPPGRLEIRRAGAAVLLDDSYNASPTSMRAAVEALCELGPAGAGSSGRRIAVLGDMLELGQETERLHRELGALVAGSPVDLLVTLGEASRATAMAFDARRTESSGGLESRTARHFDSSDEALEFLSDEIEGGDRVLFKASNALGLGRLARAIESRLEPTMKVRS